MLSDPEQRQQYDAIRAMSRGGRPVHRRRPRWRGGRVRGPVRRAVRRWRRARAPGPGNVRYTTPGPRFRPGRSRGPAGRPVRRRRRATGRGPAGFRPTRGPQRGADLAAEADPHLPAGGRGAPALAAGRRPAQRAAHHHGTDPGRGARRPEGPAARQGPARRRRAAAGRPGGHGARDAAPGVQPRRRRPHA